MSGFEVAGIALGAFTVALSTLNGYRKLAEKARIWSDVKLQYTIWRTELELRQIALDLHLRELLLPAPLDDEKIGQMVGNPSGESWRDDNVSSYLAKRLGSSGQLYYFYLGSIARTLDEAKTMLLLNCQFLQQHLDTQV